MNKRMEIVHPWIDHLLIFVKGSESVTLSQTCHKCMQPVSRDYYKCTRERCDEYYLHKECAELKDLPRIHHPLHPQHPLATQFNLPCEKSFVCSFCRETKQSRCFYQCSDDECDFYLDTTCETQFMKRPELLDKYEIQHVLHDHENHRLSPHIIVFDSNFKPEYRARCGGCTNFLLDELKTLCYAYKCIACPFYLHTECSKVPKEEVQHYSHPQHPLVLLQNPPPPAAHEVRCTACANLIEGGFYLHCNHCPTVNLHLDCYVRLKTTLKHEAHEHPLGFFWGINDDDVRCYACNTPCKYNLFRCCICNFNIHYRCLALPNTVNSDDHVDPLTLTTSFKENENQTTYHCDICEKRRDPDHGIYFCKECKFIAHFECALSLSTAEKMKYIDEPWRQKLDDEEEEDMTFTNVHSLRLNSFDELNVEIEKLGEVIQQLIIKERGGEKLTEKLQELGESYAKLEDILIRLKQSARGTNYS